MKRLIAVFTHERPVRREEIHDKKISGYYQISNSHLWSGMMDSKAKDLQPQKEPVPTHQSFSSPTIPKTGSRQDSRTAKELTLSLSLPPFVLPPTLSPSSLSPSFLLFLCTCSQGTVAGFKGLGQGTGQRVIFPGQDWRRKQLKEVSAELPCVGKLMARVT